MPKDSTITKKPEVKGRNVHSPDPKPLVNDHKSMDEEWS